MKPVAIRRRAGRALLAAAIVVCAFGCSTAGTPAPAATGTPQPGTSAAAGPTTAPTAGPASAAVPTAAPTASPVTSASPVSTAGPGPTATPTASSGRFLPVSGFPISLLTPETGVGPSPRFEWAPVPGAARYLLFVFDTNGQTYWGWDGTPTSVYLGGLDNAPSPGTMGPVLDAPMTWAVIAYDAAGKLIASSPTRPVAP